MDRVNQLRSETPGSSKDSSLDISQSTDHYVTANDISSKYISITDLDSTVTTASPKDSSPAAAVEAIENEPRNEPTLIEGLSPINQKNDDFKIGKQIEAANILSGGVDIFDNDNSFDGNELVIDDNVTVERQESNNDNLNQENKIENYEQNIDSESAIPSKDTEVILQVDGKNMDAIDIGNGLYLYRKDGQDKELAAVQILDVDQQQPGFKFLKVRENAEGNLEVYEEIVEVHKDIPEKEETLMEKNISHVPIKDINKIINDHATACKVTEITTKLLQNESSGLINTDFEKERSEVKSEFNLDSKAMKISDSSRKSPLVGSFTPMTFHSTPNKEGIPLTKTMVDMQLHPNRHNDSAKKTIEVNTDNCRQKFNESLNVDPKEAHNTKTSSNKRLFSDKKILISCADTVETDKQLATPEEQISTDVIVTADSQNLDCKEKQYILKISSDNNVYSNEKSANTAHAIDNDHLLSLKEETNINITFSSNSDNNLPKKTTKLTVVKEVLNMHETKSSDLKQRNLCGVKKVPVIDSDSNIPNALPAKSDQKSNNNKNMPNVSQFSLISNADAKHNKSDIKNQCSEELDTCLRNVKSSQPKDNCCKNNKSHNEIECKHMKLECVSAEEKNFTSIKAKTETHTDIHKNAVAVEKPKSANNNIAVPFGKWTEANKQEYLNKIKESKVPSVVGSTNQIKQPKDLNRRDVLNKIDIARNTLQSKDSFSSPKSSVKSETKEINKLPNEISVENVSRNDHAIDSSTKSEPGNRTAINNQDLIDKTIEGILMDKIVTTKVSQENDVKLDSVDKTIPEKTSCINFDNKYGIEQQTSILDDIEKKLNELHGQPKKEKTNSGVIESIVESNEVVDIKIASNKIPNLVPLIGSPNTIKQSRSKDFGEYSDEEILECEPVTGDTELMKKSSNTSYRMTETKVNLKKGVDADPIRNKQISQDKKVTQDESDKVITETDFDKFARRNSVTYENCITVNFTPQQANVAQNIVPSDLTVKKDSSNTKVKLKSQFRPISLNEKLNSPMRLLSTHKDSYYSKNPNHRMAYNMVLNPKRQKESPITIIEDKPVEVIFVESAREFQPLKLNAQGQKLTSNTDNDNFDYDSYTVSSCDSLDSDTLDATDDKPQDETQVKPIHQRKQVLTPVETPDMELIEPKDLGIEVNYKRKRKTEDSRRTLQKSDEPVSKKNNKNLVPKKSYLLGRTKERDEKQNTSTLPKEKSEGENKTNADNSFKIIDSYESNNTNSVFRHNTNAIDNLVKAAELLEKQTENNQNLTVLQTSTDTSLQPAKRGRGRPRKYPIQDSEKNKTPSPQKKPKLTKMISEMDTSDEDTDDEVITRKNWTMGKINENIICPICNKLFRSENVVFKHVKHCSGPSPTKPDSPELKNAKDNYDYNEKDETDEIEREKPKYDQIKKITQETIIDDDIILIEDSFHSDMSLVKPENKDAKGNINKESLSVNKSDLLQSKNTQTNQKSLRKQPLTKLICEICGKTFRQLSYLTHHKLLHKKSETKESGIVNDEKSIFSCEICKKEFRKLHHLVQHRLNHNSSISMGNKSRRKSSMEQNVKKHTDSDNQSSVDQGAGFRCEPCDKSFRKLHHLVEHRETHDGINKSKNLSSSQNSSEKNLTLPPKCDICNKTFRKLHHMIEHKEQHTDLKKDEKGDKKSTLIAKDIIHECSLCYMVFPNEHALNKHFIKCQRKKKSAKLKKDEKDRLSGPESVSGEDLTDTPLSSMNESEDIGQVESNKIDTVTAKPVTDNRNTLETHLSSGNDDEVLTHLNIPSDQKVEENVVNVPPITTEKHAIVKKSEIKESHKPKDTPKSKIPSGEKINANVTKRNRIPDVSIAKPMVSKHDLNDDDDNIRYMLNPNYIPEEKMKNFLKVRASRRNSLVCGSHITRRMSTQNLSKLHNSKTATKVLPDKKSTPNKSAVRKTPKKKRSMESTINAESSEDENEIKYSFPEPPKPLLSKTRKSVEGKTQAVRPTITVKKLLTTPKIVANRPKASGTTLKRNSLEKRGHTHTSEFKSKIPTHKQKEIKRRTVAEVGHKCDCGELFSSAALLARHATLAHTPPRRRRPSPPPAALALAPATARRHAAHRGLPLIDKMKKSKKS